MIVVVGLVLRVYVDGHFGLNIVVFDDLRQSAFAGVVRDGIDIDARENAAAGGEASDTNNGKGKA